MFRGCPRLQGAIHFWTEQASVTGRVVIIARLGEGVQVIIVMTIVRLGREGVQVIMFLTIVRLGVCASNYVPDYS